MTVIKILVFVHSGNKFVKCGFLIKHMMIAYLIDQFMVFLNVLMIILIHILIATSF